MFWLFNLERRICGILCCFLCLGPILVVIGVILTSAATDSRGAAISKYNDAVDAWNNVHRAEFAATVFSVQSSSSNITFPNIDTSTDPLHDSDSKIKTYLSLKYDLPLSSLIPSSFWNVAGVTAIIITNENSSYTTTENVYPMLQSTISVSCSYDDFTCQQCINSHGVWSQGTGCISYKTISDYCIKYNGPNPWMPSNSPGGNSGCGKGGNWYTTFYSTINPPNSPVSFSGLLTIRSTYDPYIIAADVTGGSYNFGLTQGQKAGTGLVIIIIGSICVLPAVLLFVCCYRRLSKKHHHHHHYEYAPVVVPSYGTYYQQ